MSLAPISRQQLLDFKAKKDEEDRLNRINHIVKIIYEHCIHVANRTNETYYNYPVPRDIKNIDLPYPFYIKNMNYLII
jgi:hypothetical protein